MSPEAPAFLLAIEGSAAAAAIRQSVWIYPAANVLHVVGVVGLAGAVAVMDLRLLGLLKGTRPGEVVARARTGAMLALALLGLTGLVLFAAEASHVGMNPVFQLKMALVAAAVLNALLISRSTAVTLARLGPTDPIPPRLRTAAAISLALWLTVPALGRLIAYV